MSWVLLLIFLGTAGAPATTSVVEFASESACHEAARQIVDDMKALRTAEAEQPRATPVVRVYCFARG